MSKRRPFYFQKKKQEKSPILMLTAYDYAMGRLLEKADVDAILVGDSLANVFSGHTHTLTVTLDQMIYHTQAVSRAIHSAMLIADMPFLSAQLSILDTKKNAGRLIQEGGAEAVKIEIGSEEDFAPVHAVTQMGIPVVGHLGLTPQRVHQLGYKVQGTSDEAAHRLMQWAKKSEECGCFALVLECIPETLAKEITQQLRIPTIGIGSGLYCDGQIRVTQDLLGLTENPPSFSSPLVHLSKDALRAISTFKHSLDHHADTV